ncbi:MAG: ABC transporter ATP-binding protein [Planctomycetota bacterium]|nr:ABC transporter ATP-binding protein [Planctomycetota bacterium]
MNLGFKVDVTGLKHRHPGQDHPVLVESLNISAGEKSAIIGPSGCGKTTLLSAIAGILVPTEGEVCVGDETISSLGDRERRSFRRDKIGLVFQEFELLEHLDIRENAFLPLWLDGVEAGEKDHALLEQRASRCGIADLLHRKPHALSQGERQRAAVCRALMTTPPLILADEPTGSLDTGSGEAVLELLFDEATLTGSTVIVVTHDRSLLDRFDKVHELSGREVS